MRFKGLDLNLLMAFDALLDTRSVSRAADRMHLSQAAMSSALGRLREYFGDEILIVQGKRMYPTAFAESLVPRVKECLRHVEEVISTSPTFDPATSQRTFRVVASDYVTGVLLAPLVADLAHTAPRVRIDILLPHDDVVKQIEDGDIDLLITPEHYVSTELPAEVLYEEEHVVAGWSENPLVQKPISENDLFGAGHVAVSIGNQRVVSYGDKQLESLGKTRRVEVVAPSFTLVPWLLEGTQRLALMHERLAIAMARHFPIAYTALPFQMPPLREMVQFHFARASDEGLAWLRGELRNIADRIVRNRG
jgi:DNA-binding transcriptional LysR family regulator